MALQSHQRQERLQGKCLLYHVIHKTLLPHQQCHLLSEFGKHNYNEEFYAIFMASVHSINSQRETTSLIIAKCCREGIQGLLALMGRS